MARHVYTIEKTRRTTVGVLLHEELNSWGIYLLCSAKYNQGKWEQLSVEGRRVENLEDARPRVLATWNDHGAEDLIRDVLEETFGIATAYTLTEMIKTPCKSLGMPLAPPREIPID